MEDKKKDVSVKRDDKDKGKSNGKSSSKVSTKNEQGPSGSGVTKRSSNGDKLNDADVSNAKQAEQPVLDKILSEIKSLGKKQNEMAEQMDSQVRIIFFKYFLNYFNIELVRLLIFSKYAVVDIDDSDDEKLAAIASSVASDRMEDGELEEDEDNLDEALLGKSH